MHDRSKFGKPSPSDQVIVYGESRGHSDARGAREGVGVGWMARTRKRVPAVTDHIAACKTASRDDNRRSHQDCISHATEVCALDAVVHGIDAGWFRRDGC